jgi:hypothetical protein
MNQTITYIDKRLEGMAASPKTFGSQEAREMQAILLLEIRSVAMGSNGYDIRGNMVRFVRGFVDGSSGSKPLHAYGFPDTLFDDLLSRFVRDNVMSMKAI